MTLRYAVAASTTHVEALSACRTSDVYDPVTYISNPSCITRSQDRSERLVASPGESGIAPNDIIDT